MRSLRPWLAPSYWGGAFLLLLLCHRLGLLRRAPAIAAGAALILVGLVSLLRALAAPLGRLLWSIRRKLILTYVFTALLPMVLVTAAFALLGYLGLGQFIGYLASTQIVELWGEVDRACREVSQVVRDRAAAAQDVESLQSRELDSPLDPGDALRSLRTRYESTNASAVVRATDGQAVYVPPGLEWPLGARARKPVWMVARHGEGYVNARFVLGEDGLLHVRAASWRSLGPLEAYVEVSVPLNPSTLERLQQQLGLDFVVYEALGDGGLRKVAAENLNLAEGFFQAIPIFGIYFLSPTRWDSGDAAQTEWTLVMRRSLAQIVGDLLDLEQNRVPIASVLALMLIIFVALQTTSVVVGLSLARSITGAVHEISDGTRRIEQGDLKHRIPVTSPDQLGDLSRSFNRMAESVGVLVRESAERERLEEELRIGRRIQQSLLPRAKLSDARLDMAALSLPAKEVGGDYYDVFTLEDERLGLLVADVSGKGTEAAFYMAEVKGIMLALTRQQRNPCDVLVAANELLGASLDRRTFVTMVYAVLDPRKGRMRFARAGHNPILHRSARTGEIASLRPRGVSLGMDRKGGFAALLEEQEIVLEAGDVVLLYTDGVTDSQAEDGELYGEARLLESLNRVGDRDAERIRDALVAELRSFAAAGPLHDDLTLIVLRVR